MRYRATVLGTLTMTVALAGLGQLEIGTAQAATSSRAAAATRAVARPAAAAAASRPATGSTVRVGSLRRHGTRVDVVVRGLHSAAQLRWVDQVVDTSFVELDGCVSAGGSGTLSRGVYRRHVYLLCSGGPARVRAAAASLRASRPWYAVGTRTVVVTGFQASVDLPVGNGDAVPAALAQLPHREFTWVDGDDVAFAYVGVGVTQRRLDAALRAFAAAQHVSLRRVHVSRLSL